MPSHDVFYSQMLNQASQFEVMSNQVWPLVLSLHHNFGLKVTHGIKSTDDARKKEFCVIMGTDSGSPVVRVRYGMQFTKKGSPKGMLLSVGQHNASGGFIESTNVRYVLKHISSKGSDAYDTIEKTRLRAENFYPEGLVKASRIYYREGLSEIRRTDGTFSSRVYPAVLEALFDSKPLLSMDQEIQDELKEANKRRLKFNKELAAHINNTKSVFSGDKWMLLSNMYGGWHVGALNGDDLIPVLLSEASESTDAKYIKLLKMIKLVPTIHHMDPEYKDEIMGKLMVNKMSNSTPGKDYQCADPDGLIPTTNYLKVFSSGLISLNHYDRVWCFVQKS
jgi:hypothetical protein